MILRFLTNHSKDIKKVTLNDASGNDMLIAPLIQKYIRDISNALFSVLINEFYNVFIKEQMAVVLRYVDKNETVTKCSIGLKHITSTTAISLKKALD